MASVNKVILVGNCGRDPEIRYLPSGQAVANISIATSSRRKDRNTGETVEDTQWHRVTFYDRLAEIAGEYVRKGRPLYVEGRLKYGKYTDQSGVEKNTVDIIATELQLLGGREGGGMGGGMAAGGEDGGYDAAPAPAPRRAPAGGAAPRSAPTGGGGYGASASGGYGGGAPRPAPAAAPVMPAKSSSGFDDMDDDIPF
jgi:single-strand DNA-binding protein